MNTIAKLERDASRKRFERLLLHQIKAAGLPEPAVEWRFHGTRQWRFDFAYLHEKIGIEVDGAIWAQGRHTRGAGFMEDCNKFNEAALLGWRILRFPTDLVESGAAIAVIERALRAEDR